MSLPSSDRFNIVDYSYRAQETGEGEVFTPSVFDEALVPHAGLEINGDGIQFHVDHNLNEARTEKATFHLKDSLEYVTGDGSEAHGVPEDFSIEFDILLTEDIPRDFSNIENRLFVGAINAQGYSSGILFSHQGMALAAYPEDPEPRIMGGSLNLLIDKVAGGSFYEDGTNVRVIINGHDGRVTVYAAPTKDAYDPGSGETNTPVFYSGQAMSSGNFQEDSLVVWASGETVAKQLSENGPDNVYPQDVAFFIRSLRLASYKVIPEDSPLAVTKSSPYLTLGERVVLSGIDSYDPNAKQITYNWEIEVAPKESRATLEGSSRGTSTLTSISEYDGSEIDIVQISFIRPTEKANDFVTNVYKAAFGEPLSLGWDDEGGVLTIALEVDSDGEILTNASDIVDAFMNRLSPAYDPMISGGTNEGEDMEYPQLFRADLVEIYSAGTETPIEGLYAFSGGSGSTLPNPGFIADKQGIYVFSLQVNNGKRKSRKSRLTCTASNVTQLLGHRPNTKYIFKYLPDFWNLVNDSEQVESIWSSVTQVISNEMLQTWQNDYAKSLKDISRQYQRRWLSIPTFIDLDEEVTTELVTNQVLVKGIEVPHIKSGFKAKFSDSSEIWNQGEVLLPGLKLVKSSVTQPYVVNVTGVEALYSSGIQEVEQTIEHHCEGIPGMITVDKVTSVETQIPTGYYRMIAAGQEFVKYRVISERSAGYFSVDPEDPNATSPIVTSVMRDMTYPMFNIDKVEDLLRIYGDREVLFSRVVESNLSGDGHMVRLADLEDNLLAQAADGIPVYWDHLIEPQNTTLHNTPYITLNGCDVPGMDLRMGDTVRLSFIDPYLNTTVTKEAPILATYGNSIFLEWACVVEHLNTMAAQANDDMVYTEEDINNLSFSADRIIRTREMEAVQDLVASPRLGFNTIVPEFSESIDYSIISGSVVVTDLFSGLLTSESGSDIVTFNPGYVRHKELEEAGFDILKLSEAGVHCIQITTGTDAGFYRIQSIDEETGAIQLDRQLTTTSNKCKFMSPRFSLYGRPGELLWSELSFFDNWKTIENNFGLFVGLPKDMVDNYDPELDYLSVIKSMWFAFLSGPSFDNVRLAVQSLFGLPFSEVDGRVILNEEPTPTKEGLLLVMDGAGRIYTYHYPYGSELSTNPNTGRQIKAYDNVSESELENLSPEQVRRYNDSRVSAYTRLVDVVKVEDYISDFEMVENAMSGSDYKYIGDDNKEHVVDLPPSLLQKYHTFVVDVPLQVARKTSVFPLISDFLQEAKPAYTNFILRGSILFSDEVNVIEEMFLHPTILLKDTPHTSPFFATKLGEDAFGQPAVLPEQEVKIWPVEKTYEKYDIDFSPILDASHFCLSGPYMSAAAILLLAPVAGARLRINSDVLGTNLGKVYQNPQKFEWHPIMEEIMKVFNNGTFNPPHGGVAMAVPGTPDFEIFAITEFVVEEVLPTDDPDVFLIERVRFQLGEPNNPQTPKLPTGALAPYNPLNCLFFTPDNFPPPMPIQVNWDDEDVKEKYESGYCEGVLDDYSGDGSWNFRRAQLDMVNTVNSDIDVVRSRQWVRITHYWQHPTEAQNFFQVGETLSMAGLNGESVSADIWDSAPPVVLHVGYGENPKLPHVEHPAMKVNPNGLDTHWTYLIIGFEVPREGVNSVAESDAYDYENAGVNNYGHESRLDVIKWAQDTYGHGQFFLVGNTSGAMAKCSEDVNRDFRSYKETIWQVDKLLENGPASDPTLTLTTYFPVDDAGANAYPSGTGGLTIAKFRGRSESFDPDHDDTSAMYQWEYQQIPPTVYPPPDPDIRMIPSFSPGFYTGWDLNGGDIANEKVVWGYKHDGGSLEAAPLGINDFERPDNHATSYLQNVHMGMTVSARKDVHVTHGFTNFRIPPPSIKMILPSSAGYDLRICGFYFCNDDPSRVNIPTSTPSSFGNPVAGEGIIGGSWVFFRNSETLEEIGNVDWSFETGMHLGEPILPKGPLNDGVSTYILGSNDQASDGHIIECHVPNLQDEGYYDVIIRNYRPYLEPGDSWGDPSTWAYHMDETVALRAYYHGPDGHGGISWGTDPFGTGGNN